MGSSVPLLRGDEALRRETKELISVLEEQILGRKGVDRVVRLAKQHQQFCSEDENCRDKPTNHGLEVSFQPVCKGNQHQPKRKHVRQRPAECKQTGPSMQNACQHKLAPQKQRQGHRNSDVREAAQRQVGLHGCGP